MDDPDDHATSPLMNGPQGSRSSPCSGRLLHLVPALAVALMVFFAALLSPSSTSAPQGSGQPRVLNVELGGVCGTLVGAGVTVVSFAKEAINKARGGWAGAAIAGGCLLHDAWEYKKKYDSTPERLAEFAAIKRQWESYRTYEDMMTKGFGCERKLVPKAHPDDRYDEMRYHWDCSKGPYAGYD